MGKVQMSKLKRNEKGITLVALVVTIIVLIILAGIAISMTIGENGIFTKAKEAKRLQITAEAKEKIGTEILAAQVEAIERNEELEQAQVEDIISKYGTLQDDKDTIVLKDNGYTVSLSDIYTGTTTSAGSYSELKAKVALLEQKLEDASKTQTESNKELSDLKTLLTQTTVTEDKMLKDYTAYKDGKLIIGSMVNNAGKTVVASNITESGSNAEITIPEEGYYGIDSKVSIPVEKIKSEVGSINSGLNKEHELACSIYVSPMVDSENNVRANVYLYVGGYNVFPLTWHSRYMVSNKDYYCFT